MNMPFKPTDEPKRLRVLVEKVDRCYVATAYDEVGDVASGRAVHARTAVVKAVDRAVMALDWPTGTQVRLSIVGMTPEVEEVLGSSNRPSCINIDNANGKG